MLPVTFDTNDEEMPGWEPWPCELIKELKQAVVAYGPTAPYVLTLVDNLGTYWLAPSDWN